MITAMMMVMIKIGTILAIMTRILLLNKIMMTKKYDFHNDNCNKKHSDNNKGDIIGTKSPSS